MVYDLFIYEFGLQFRSESFLKVFFGFATNIMLLQFFKSFNISRGGVKQLQKFL